LPTVSTTGHFRASHATSARPIVAGAADINATDAASTRVSLPPWV